MFSSALGYGREVISGIPADHEHMTKFSEPSDIGFKRITATLKRWIDDIKKKRQSIVVKTLQGMYATWGTNVCVLIPLYADQHPSPRSRRFKGLLWKTLHQEPYIVAREDFSTNTTSSELKENPRNWLGGTYVFYYPSTSQHTTIVVDLDWINFDYPSKPWCR